MNSLPENAAAELPHEAIEEQARRILNSERFQASRQLSTFFKFVIDETLAGRGDQLKAYTIAVQAFGRDSDFDPQLDPFIRVLAGRLRRALDMYYYTEGAQDPVVIKISKGSYKPEFYASESVSSGEQALSGTKESAIETQTENSVKPTSAPKTFFNRRILIILIVGTAVLFLGFLGWLLLSSQNSARGNLYNKPSVIVLPLKNLSQDAQLESFMHSLATDLSNRLSRFKDFVVISYYSARSMDDKGTDIFTTLRKLGVDYALTGSFIKINNLLRVDVQLLNLNTNQQIWGSRFERTLTVNNLFSIEDEIAKNIVNRIGGGYGVISRELTSASISKRPTQLGVFEAIATFRAYDYYLTPELYNRAFISLQQAVKTEPNNALAWAMLGNLYLNAYTLGIAGIDSAFSKGIQCIRRAIRLDPEEPFARSLEGFMYQLMGKPDLAMKSNEKAIVLNPNNGYLVSISGWDMVIQGHFERGLEYMKKGMKLNPYYPGYFHLAYYLDYFRKGQYAKALAEVDKMDFEFLFWDPLLRTVALVKLGKIEEARQTYKEIVRRKADFPERMRFYVQCYIPQKLLPEFIHALNTAGKMINGG